MQGILKAVLPPEEELEERIALPYLFKGIGLVDEFPQLMEDVPDIDRYAYRQSIQLLRLFRSIRSLALLHLILGSVVVGQIFAVYQLIHYVVQFNLPWQTKPIIVEHLLGPTVPILLHQLRQRREYPGKGQYVPVQFLRLIPLTQRLHEVLILVHIPDSAHKQVVQLVIIFLVEILPVLGLEPLIGFQNLFSYCGRGRIEFLAGVLFPHLLYRHHPEEVIVQFLPEGLLVIVLAYVPVQYAEQYSRQLQSRPYLRRYERTAERGEEPSGTCSYLTFQVAEHRGLRYGTEYAPGKLLLCGPDRAKEHRQPARVFFSFHHDPELERTGGLILYLLPTDLLQLVARALNTIGLDLVLLAINLHYNPLSTVGQDLFFQLTLGYQCPYTRRNTRHRIHIHYYCHYGTGLVGGDLGLKHLSNPLQLPQYPGVGIVASFPTGSTGGKALDVIIQHLEGPFYITLCQSPIKCTCYLPADEVLFLYCLILLPGMISEKELVFLAGLGPDLQHHWDILALSVDGIQIRRGKYLTANRVLYYYLTTIVLYPLNPLLKGDGILKDLLHPVISTVYLNHIHILIQHLLLNPLPVERLVELGLKGVEYPLGKRSLNLCDSLFHLLLCLYRIGDFWRLYLSGCLFRSFRSFTCLDRAGYSAHQPVQDPTQGPP